VIVWELQIDGRSGIERRACLTFCDIGEGAGDRLWGSFEVASLDNNGDQVKAGESQSNEEDPLLRGISNGSRLMSAAVVDGGEVRPVDPIGIFPTVWWLATKPSIEPDTVLFPVAERKTAKMMRLDLERCGIPYVDDNRDVADFHANRHTFISNLGRAGVPPKTAQSLARHSDINLTMGVYSHVAIRDQAAAIESLPSPPDVGVESGRQPRELQAIGTDDRLALRPVLKGDFSCPDVSSVGTGKGQETGKPSRRKSLKNKPLGNDCHQEAAVVQSSGGGTRTPDTRIMIPLL